MTDIKSNLKSFEDKAETLRTRTAETLESAADSFRAVGNESADTITGFTNEAGKKLDSTATFVRNTCVKEKVVAGCRNAIRRNPMGSLAVAAAVGIFAGFFWRPAR